MTLVAVVAPGPSGVAAVEISNDAVRFQQSLATGSFDPMTGPGTASGRGAVADPGAAADGSVHVESFAAAVADLMSGGGRNAVLTTTAETDATVDLGRLLTPQSTGVDLFLVAVRQAVISHPELEERLWRGQEARGLVRESRAAYWPQVSGGFTTGVGFFDGNANDNRRSVANTGTTTEADLFVSAEQLIHDFGATDYRVAAADAASRGVDAEVHLLANSLSRTAVEIWLDIFVAHLRGLLVQENMTVHELVLGYAEARQDGGVGSSTEVVRARARLANARARAADLAAARAEVESRFVEIFGRPPPAEPFLPPVLAVLPATFDDAVSIGLSGNPRLLAARLVAAQRRHESLSAEAAYYPSFRFQVRATQFDVLSGDGDYELSGRIVGQLSLDTSGLTGARVEQAQARRIQATRAVNRAQREVSRQIGSAFQSLDARRRAADEAETALKDNELSRRAVLQRFRVRGVSLLEVLQAQEDYFDAALQLIDARVQAQKSAYQLAEAMGSLSGDLDIVLSASSAMQGGQPGEGLRDE